MLDGHVVLEVHCADRLLLNAYVPKLQVGGQVVTFLTEHLGFPVPSPALLQKIGNRFCREVKAFAAQRALPVLNLKKPDRTRWDDRKLDHVRPYLDKAEAEGRSGVVAIVHAQEFQWVYSAKNRSTKPGRRLLRLRKRRAPGRDLLLLHLRRRLRPRLHQDLHLLPLPGQGLAERPRVGQAPGPVVRASSSASWPTALPPAPNLPRLQAICDRFGPADVQGFFDRWAAVVPTPFTAEDKAAGYFWELSMRQVEVSRTLVFDDPRRARGFFEALVTDNIGIGRPEEVRAVFGRDRRGRGTTQPLLHPCLFPRHRGAPRLLLQAQPGQAVPEGGQGAKDRDRRQQTERHRGARPARAPARAHRQGSSSQRPPA